MTQNMFCGTQSGRPIDSAAMTRPLIFVLTKWSVGWRTKQNAVFDVNDTGVFAAAMLASSAQILARNRSLHQWASISRKFDMHGLLGKVIV